MGNLREKIENDVAITLEGKFGLPVELTAPDGATQIYSAHDPEDENLLMGQVLYDGEIQNPETGESVIIEEPVVSLRLTSLDRIPKAGEVWGVAIPNEPRADADKDYYVTTDLPFLGGRSIGFIKLFLTKPKQSL